MEARHLRYALAVAEHQHFGRAAAALGIAQPPLSRQIADLEREVGERLFDRTPGGVFPTAAGAAFLAPARRALCEMSAAAVEAGRAARGETGRLRVGFIGSALLRFLPSVLAPFRRDHPDVRLELREMSTARSAAALTRGELDLAVGRGAPRGAGAEELVTVTVGRDHLVTVVGTGHPYAGLKTVSLAQLGRQHLIVTPADDEPAVRAGLRALLEDNTLALDTATEARDVHTIIGLAACGVGAGLGPSCMRAAGRPDTWFCDVTPRTPLPDLVLSHRRDDRSPVLAAFLEETRRSATTRARPGRARGAAVSRSDAAR
ncbi:LysR family transcriptional regulator [Streptomyces ochraceiscleroticus]|uniref:LysR family transcriptional regulator n=1 Tax=Streptomyces ochraceiscleroticus TaxID=47761 RepID=A0ABW1MUI7_9ACTN|nr:LysR family transcriptional regulator [Streptomyces ochraceiscleroticus]